MTNNIIPINSPATRPGGAGFPATDMLLKNQNVEILKELFDKNKIEMISDLSTDELKLITRILIIAELKDIPVWASGVQMFLKLGLSRKRESRKEIIRAIEGLNRKKNIGERIKDVFTGGET